MGTFVSEANTSVRALLEDEWLRSRPSVRRTREVPGKRERAISQRENESAVANRVPIQHVLAYDHGQFGAAGTHVRDADAERPRRRVACIHRLGNAFAMLSE